MRGQLVASLCLVSFLVFPAPADANSNPGFAVWTPDMLGIIGETIQVPIYLVTPSTAGAAFILHCDSDENSLVPLNVTYGPGMEAHVLQDGEPPICDVVVFPAAIDLYLELAGLYTSGNYGFQFLLVEYEVVAPIEGVSSISYTLDCATPGGTIGGDPSYWTQIQSTAEVHIYTTLPAGAPFIRGDANGDSFFNIADAIFLLSALFIAGPFPTCLDAADSNDDSVIDIADTIDMLNKLFGTGLPHVEACEIDAGPDGFLPCAPSC